MANSEVWKDIDGYEGRYMVSNTGKVKSLSNKNAWGFSHKGRILKPVLKEDGYVRVYLSNCKREKRLYYVHRIVASAFIQNPDNLPQVNHIDGNKQNNNMNNLEWCTIGDNVRHGFKNGLYSRQIKIEYKGVIYQNITEAARITGESYWIIRSHGKHVS